MTPELGRRIFMGSLFAGIALMLVSYMPPYFTEEAMAHGSVMMGLLFAAVALAAIVYAYRIVFASASERKVDEIAAKQKGPLPIPLLVFMGAMVGLILMFIVMEAQR